MRYFGTGMSLVLALPALVVTVDAAAAPPDTCCALLAAAVGAAGCVEALAFFFAGFAADFGFSAGDGKRKSLGVRVREQRFPRVGCLQLTCKLGQLCHYAITFSRQPDGEERESMSEHTTPAEFATTLWQRRLKHTKPQSRWRARGPWCVQV